VHVDCFESASITAPSSVLAFVPEEEFSRARLERIVAALEDVGVR